MVKYSSKTLPFFREVRKMCKELMRTHIDALRKHVRLRAFLVHLEHDKRDCPAKYQSLMDEFDEKKKGIVSELRSKHVDKVIFIANFKFIYF